MNELIDEAVGRVMAKIRRGLECGHRRDLHHRSRRAAGRFRLCLQRPVHVDALMRLPFIWRPAPNAKVEARDRRPAGGAGRSSRRRAPSRVSNRRRGCRARRCRSEDGRASARSANGTASFRATAFISLDLSRRLHADALRAIHDRQPNGLEETWPQFAGHQTHQL